ncbi:hypothetical protein [Roseiarcus sp.]|uniref:hypothetical protein n=1 Tax=Roseiarcus sp. TaxID=1969460 RepID=UPI003F94C3F2
MRRRADSCARWRCRQRSVCFPILERSECLEIRPTKPVSKTFKFWLGKHIEQGRRGGEHDLQDRLIRPQQFGHQAQITERPMRKRVGVVDRKDDPPIRIGRQLRQHGQRRKVAAALDAEGGANPLLQFRRLRQRPSDVQDPDRGAGERSERGFGRPRRDLTAARDENRPLSRAESVNNELKDLQLGEASHCALL